MSNQLSKPLLLHLMTTQLALPHEAKIIMDRYYTLSWSGEMLRDCVREGKIYRDQLGYNICWLDTPTNCYDADWIVLSFRFNKACNAAYVCVQTLLRKHGKPELAFEEGAGYEIVQSTKEL